MTGEGPITAQQVKELRERTGVGMSKCKEALEKAKGNMEEAIDILRKQGMASAVKKEGRETKEGAIFVKETPDAIACIEINCETDFVVKNEKFQKFGNDMAEELALRKSPTREQFLEEKYSKDPSITIEGERALIVQQIGENIQVRRTHVIQKKPECSYGIYSHMGGKIVTCAELSQNPDVAIAKDVAMHIAAYSPEYIKPEDVPASIIEKEKEIARTQIQGKPAFVVDKILEGKVNAYFDLVCLTRQKFVKEMAITVGEYIKSKTKDKPADVLSFIRWSVGQS
jgi:elongation factor Ts